VRRCAWLLVLCVCAGVAGATEARIARIEIEGLHWLEKSTVLDRLEVRSGDRFDRRAIGESIKALIRSGFVSDVKVYARNTPNGVVLRFIVRENPIIGSVRFSGNEEFSDKTLKTRLKELKPGRVLSAGLKQRVLSRLRKGYFKKGYYQMQAELRTKRRPDGRVDVVVAIDEGPQTRIKRIQLLGVRAFEPEEILHEIISRPETLGAAITDRDIFRREAVSADVQLIERFYQNRGFLDARVDSATSRLALDRSGFLLAYAVREGVRYRVGKIRLEGDLVPSEEALRKRIKLVPGQWYSLAKLQETIDALTKAVGDEGYAYATVTPLFRRDPENQLVEISFVIEKGRRIYLHRIRFSGNEHTDDLTLRRELRQDEAALYSASAMEQSEKRLRRLPMVEDLKRTLKRVPGSRSLVDLDFEVKERKSGSLSLGVGYSQLEKTFVQGRISEQNLFGKGYQLSFNGQIGARTQNYSVSFTDPYFLSEEVSATFSLYKQGVQFNQVLAAANYQTNSFGGSLGFRIPISEAWGWGINYRYDRTFIANVPANASLLLQSQAGKQTTGELGLSIDFDTRDNLLTPSEGAFWSASISQAGLGGSNRFTEARMQARYYHPLDAERRWIAALSLKLAAIGGPKLPLYRRYSLGGLGSVRGFDVFGISLRDPKTQEALGGDRYWTGSLNLYVPLPGVRTAGFRGVLFVDAGQTWGKIDASFAGQRLKVTEPFSLGRMRASVGFGVEWVSPIGPLGFYWGFPVKKQPADLLRRFVFALGAMF